MPSTKKLEKLLLKYKKANQARHRAYCRRSRLIRGVGMWMLRPDRQDGLKDWTYVHKIPVTPELKAELDAAVEKARLYKLEVSKELRAYCKKKKYHIRWGTSCQITGVLSDLGYKLRKHPNYQRGNALLAVLRALKLSTQPRYFL